MVSANTATRTASWYHCSVKPISRSNGRTAIAAVAYRTGTRLHDRQLDRTWDFTRRSGVETAFIVAAGNVPAWTYDLETLWNTAQEKDNRKNSRLARECELALPSVLDAGEREELAREFAEHLVDRYGVAVSVALHEPSRHGDDRNYHAHIVFTTRRMDGEGLGEKTREIDNIVTGAQEIEHIREYAASLINSYLEDAGSEERVTHLSYQERGIDKTGTDHLGVDVARMEKRGQRTVKGDRNRAIEEHNRNTDTLVNELAELDRQIAAEMEKRFLGIEQPDISAPPEPDEGTTPFSFSTPHEEQQKPVIPSFAEALPDTREMWEAWQEPPPEIPREQSKGLTYTEWLALAPEPEIIPPFPTAQEAPPVMSWQELKEAGQKNFIDDVTATFKADIAERGEVQEYGLGKNWYDRTIAAFENLYYGFTDVVEGVKDSWQRYVGKRSRDPDREERDRGDMERW